MGGAGATPCLGQVGKVGQVVAAGEGIGRAREQNDADGVIAGGRLQGVRHLRVHHLGEGVLLAGAVHLDGEDTIAGGGQNVSCHTGYSLLVIRYLRRFFFLAALAFFFLAISCNRCRWFGSSGSAGSNSSSDSEDEETPRCV